MLIGKMETFSLTVILSMDLTILPVKSCLHYLLAGYMTAASEILSVSSQFPHLYNVIIIVQWFIIVYLTEL